MQAIGLRQKERKYFRTLTCQLICLKQLGNIFCEIMAVTGKQMTCAQVTKLSYLCTEKASDIMEKKQLQYICASWDKQHRVY